MPHLAAPAHMGTWSSQLRFLGAGDVPGSPAGRSLPCRCCRCCPGRAVLSHPCSWTERVCCAVSALPSPAFSGCVAVEKVPWSGWVWGLFAITFVCFPHPVPRTVLLAAPQAVPEFCGSAVGTTGLLLLRAPRAAGMIPDDVSQSHAPEGLHCPAGDLMTLFGCGLQEKELEITLDDLELPLGYTYLPLEGTADLSSALLEVQNLPPAASRLLQ